MEGGRPEEARETVDDATEERVRAILRRNLEALGTEISAACARVGRPEDAVHLVAVTKSVPVEVAALLPGLGVHRLGERRPEVGCERARWFAARGVSAEWHMIGHYQRRKVASTAAAFALLHGVDRDPLLEKLGSLPDAPPVLIQVNVSGEESKQGYGPEELPAALEVAARAGLRVEGLMTMAPYAAAEPVVRACFGGLRELARRHRSSTFPLETLSMGMSGDFGLAIEEGATVIRVGTRLFEGLALS